MIINFSVITGAMYDTSNGMECLCGDIDDDDAVVNLCQSQSDMPSSAPLSRLTCRDYAMTALQKLCYEELR